MNNTKLINRMAVRREALAILRHERPTLESKLTRVGGDFYLMAERQMYAWMVRHIQQMPSKGKTIR
jgi:hypothetical protein